MTEKRGRGRPNKYDTHVAPRLAEIVEWAKAGSTVKEIAAALDVGVTNFMKYMNDYPQLRTSIEDARKSGVATVRNALLKICIGYEYEEKKTYIKRDEDGNQSQYTEVTKKHVKPNPAAIAMYLRNYSDEFSDSDALTREVKKLEMELKKKLSEDEW